MQKNLRLACGGASELQVGSSTEAECNFFELNHQLSWLNTKTFVLDTYWSFRTFQSFCGLAKAKMRSASYGSPKQLAQELHEKSR
jgi:hypothetical protein